MLLFDLKARPDATLLDVLDFQASRNGDAVWLRQDEFRITFADARRSVDRYAAGFASQGLQAGQTVALVVGPSVEMASIVREHGLGVIAPDFTPASLAACLVQLDAARIEAFKQSRIWRLRRAKATKSQRARRKQICAQKIGNCSNWTHRVGFQR